MTLAPQSTTAERPLRPLADTSGRRLLTTVERPLRPLADTSGRRLLTTVERPLRPLEDPSGRRRRWMRWVGRSIALVFLLWFVALVLGAFGVAPSGGSNLGRALGPQSDPPRLAQAH